MRSHDLLPSPARHVLVFALLGSLFAACSEGPDNKNPPSTGGSGGGGAGGSPVSSSSSSSSSGTGGGCAETCTAGATQCSGNGVQTCATMPNGCTDWGSPVACTPGKMCSDGQCAVAHSTLVAAESWSCALVNGIGIKCWGNNQYGMLGLGDVAIRGDGPNEMGANLPVVNLGTGKTAIAIEGGTTHTCALLEGGDLKCWGGNQYGQLGVGDMMSRGDAPNELGDNLPAADLGTGKTAIAFSVGAYHTCALLDDGSVKCWGDNQGGVLGLGDQNRRGDGPNEMGDNLPAVDLGTGKTAVALGRGYHTCALLNDGSVKCWGNNSTGELGLGDTNARGDSLNEMGDNLPVVDLGTGKTAVAISGGLNHTCALLNDGSVKCWGFGGKGRLGLGDEVTRGDEPNEMGDNLPAVNLGTGKTAVAISTGWDHTCALLNDGSVKCWGANNWGQLGLGDWNNRGDSVGGMGDNLPAVDLGMDQIAIGISTGRNHTCARLQDGGVKCWGWNGAGELGQGDTKIRGDQPNEMGDLLPPISL